MRNIYAVLLMLFLLVGGLAFYNGFTTGLESAGVGTEAPLGNMPTRAADDARYATVYTTHEIATVDLAEKINELYTDGASAVSAPVAVEVVEELVGTFEGAHLSGALMHRVTTWLLVAQWREGWECPPGK